MIQRSKTRKKEDSITWIEVEEKRDKVRLYTKAMLSTSIVILILIGYCLLYITKQTAEYYICLFTIGINLIIIILAIILKKRNS